MCLFAKTSTIPLKKRSPVLLGVTDLALTTSAVSPVFRASCRVPGASDTLASASLVRFGDEIRGSPGATDQTTRQEMNRTSEMTILFLGYS